MTNKNVKNQILNYFNSFSYENLDILRSKTFLKPLVKTMIRDSLLDEIKLDDDTVKNCSENFFIARSIDNKEKKEDFLIQNLMDENDLFRVSSTQHKSNLFSLQLFGNKAEEYFQKRKSDLNQYVYSLIQVKDKDLAQELYLSLDSNECEFATLASKYSLGPEKYKNGIEGPISLSQLNSEIQNILKSSEKGIINEPISLNGVWIVLRIEEILYAEFSDQMKKFLSNELFELFLERLTREIMDEIRNKNYSEKFKKSKVSS